MFDPKGKWAELDRCRALFTRRELYDVIRAGASGRFAFISPRRADFGYWADCAYWWTRLGALHGLRSVIVAEELSAFTNAGKAPQGWHLAVTQGLEFALDIWALVQRPAESDKTCIGNATRLRAFAMTRAADCAYIARELDCPAREVAALAPLHYLQRDMVSGVLSRGVVSAGKLRKPSARATGKAL